MRENQQRSKNLRQERAKLLQEMMGKGVRMSTKGETRTAINSMPQTLSQAAYARRILERATGGTIMNRTRES